MSKHKSPRIKWYELARKNSDNKITPSDFCKQANTIATRYLNRNKFAKKMSWDILHFRISEVNALIADKVDHDKWENIYKKRRINVYQLARHLKASFPTSASKVLFKVSYAANRQEDDTKKCFWRTLSTKRALISREIIRVTSMNEPRNGTTYDMEDVLNLTYIGILLGMITELRSLRYREAISLIRKFDTATTVHKKEDGYLPILKRRIQEITIEEWSKNPFRWHNDFIDPIHVKIKNEFKSYYKAEYKTDIPKGLSRRINEKLVKDAVRDIALELNLLNGKKGHKMPVKNDENKNILLGKLNKIKEGLHNGTFPPKR